MALLLEIASTLLAISANRCSRIDCEAEEHDAIRRAEEAKNAAARSFEVAVLKRKRAQLLMKNADLATYKAVKALKIAEAAQLTTVPREDFILFILD
ncbi:hypothetical protein GIB67_024189 [Kingdonia uniflora]|uniref:Uncharacterized protein n=1 Tax=Kingdonia uniflora TaxID=39325 RepID=A0A7J7LZN2_9MAGN|nr:hypothetical protein GIB67_024189 [Kingdonia uniflora]